MSDYIGIHDGKPCPLEIPEVIEVPVSTQVNENFSYTKMVTARKGDPDYDKVLEAWMFIQGYIHAGRTTSVPTDS